MCKVRHGIGVLWWGEGEVPVVGWDLGPGAGAGGNGVKG